MFVYKLNDSEKQILMDLLMILAKVDNRFAKREASHLLAMSKKHDLEMKFELDPDITVDSLCSEINKDQSKIIIIQELIWAARIDCDYCDNEKILIKGIMKSLGINQNKYKEIDVWVNKGIRWEAQGEKIISSLDVFL